MKVYHGSYMVIDKIDLARCKPRKDFGQGFYVTKLFEQATFWAERVGREHETEGIITEFELDEFAWEEDELQTLRFDGYNEAWLDFVVLNRSARKRTDNHLYDIVEGAVADDDITHRIDMYLRGDIAKVDFLEELKFHRPTHQIAFCTVKSLQMLERIKRTPETAIENIDKAVIEALIAESGIKEKDVYDLYYASKTYACLTNETTGLWQKPWTEIYHLLLQEWKKNK
jgi:hypothetical protein